MSKNEKKEAEPASEELRTAAWADWIKEQQTAAVRANEPIKTVFRVTVAIDLVAEDVEAAKVAVKKLKGEGIFVYGLKGVRRLVSLFETSEEFKNAAKRGEQVK